jgi:hypothetical protein
MTKRFALWPVNIRGNFCIVAVLMATDSLYGGTGAPSDNGYTKIYSTEYAFAALKADGSITAWGKAGFGGTGAPSDNGYTKIFRGRT